MTLPAVPATSDPSGLRRSALLMRALGARAAAVWSQLTEDEAAQLSHAMQSLPDDRPAERDIVRAYVAEMTSPHAAQAAMHFTTCRPSSCVVVSTRAPQAPGDDGQNRLIRTIRVRASRKGRPGIAGDHGSGATPVPIPNTEVKPGPPMILLCGKVGRCRLITPSSHKLGGVFLFLYRSPGTNASQSPIVE